ncbi:MAG: 8-oxoguanine deaminase [Halieaceae bacterium]|nr:8-oxoguanine deaminase [Halieaceae bacterium]
MSAASGGLWLANPTAVWTGNPQDDAGGGVVVKDAQIVELVPQGAQPRTACAERIDASGLVLLPGLVNTHHHFYQTLTRALPAAQNKELFDWLGALYPVWAGMDEEAIAVSTELALAELLLSGCTTAADHHYVFSEAFANAIDIQVEVARRLGVRVTLTRGSMSLGQSSGGLPPDHLIESAETILADSERLIAEYHDPSQDAMVQIALAPCSPFSVTGELMRDTAILARSQGVRLHTHLAETEDENDFCLAQFGLRPLPYLETLDWVADDVWLAHGIHFDDDEIARIGAAGMGVCHCPSSNMLLASGLCRSLELEAAGAPVGLGVDGSASNDHSNMIQEVRQAFLLQRLRYGSAAVSADDALRWATRGGARLLGRPELGTLQVGAPADIALFDLEELRFSGAGDPVAALLTCGASRAAHVMVNGQWRVQDGSLCDMDIADLRRRHEAAAARLRG